MPLKYLIASTYGNNTYSINKPQKKDGYKNWATQKEIIWVRHPKSNDPKIVKINIFVTFVLW